MLIFNNNPTEEMILERILNFFVLGIRPTHDLGLSGQMVAELLPADLIPLKERGRQALAFSRGGGSLC